MNHDSINAGNNIQNKASSSHIIALPHMKMITSLLYGQPVLVAVVIWDDIASPLLVLILRLWSISNNQSTLVFQEDYLLYFTYPHPKTDLSSVLVREAKPVLGTLKCYGISDGESFDGRNF